MDGYTLCQILGRWDHPDDMLASLTLPQYLGWLRWMRHFYPYPDRQDVLWGMLTAAVENQWRDPHSPPVLAKDRMPYLRRDDDDEDDGAPEGETADDFAMQILNCI